MEILIKREALADAILSPQVIAETAKEQNWRLCQYVHSVETDEGILLYNLLTGEMVKVRAIEEDKEELFKKYFLVEQQHDDYRLFEQFTKLYGMLKLKGKNSINSYTILPTTDCNARCFYCYEQGVERKKMAPETAQHAVEYICRNADTQHPVHLAWFGGEPLYNYPAIDKICTLLRDEKIDYSSSMVSNGYLFDNEINKKARDLWNLKKVQITLDGTEEIYNRRKAYIYNSAESPFKKVLGNIASLSDAGIKVNIRLNLDKDNQKDLLELIDMINDKFRNHENISIYCHELFQCSEDESISGLKQEINQKIRESGFYKDKGIPLKIRNNYCMADSANSIIIMPDGTLHACEHFNKQKPVGTIYNNDNKLKELPYYRERLIEERCRSCRVLPVCIKLKHCPDTRSGCSKETAEKKLSDIEKSMLQFIKQNNGDNS